MPREHVLRVSHISIFSSVRKNRRFLSLSFSPLLSFFLSSSSISIVYMNSTHSSATIALVHSPLRAFPLRYSRLARVSLEKQERIGTTTTHTLLLHALATLLPAISTRIHSIRSVRRAAPIAPPRAIFTVRIIFFFLTLFDVIRLPHLTAIRAFSPPRTKGNDGITLKENKTTETERDSNERKKEKERERQRDDRRSGNNGRSLFHITGSRLGRNRRDTLPRVHPLETDLS